MKELGVMLIDLFFGDAKLKLDVANHSELVLKHGDPAHKNFVQNYEVTVPYKNVGRQELTILDAWARVYLPDEQYAELTINPHLCESTKPRQDGYFEAMLVPAGKGGNLVLKLQAIARNYTGAEDELAKAIANCPEFDVAIYAECRGRGKIFIEKDIFTLKLK